MSARQHLHHNFETISIIGIGLIGGSFARLIRYHLPDTVIFALDKPEVLEEALFGNIIDAALEGLEDPRLYKSDLIILGTHLTQSIDILKALVQLVPSPIKVMDLGSTKSTICSIAESIDKEFLFIGGHPLGGREVSGFTNSRWDLFHNKRFLLVPCSKTPLTFRHSIIKWLKSIETIPIVLDDKNHDKLMSLVSHFPQFYAVALANLLAADDPEEVLQFLGGGIDDQMRLMASPYDMWSDIFKDNKRNLNHVLEQFIDILRRMQQSLTEDNLAPWFEESHRIYQLYQSRKFQLNTELKESKKEI